MSKAEAGEGLTVTEIKVYEKAVKPKKHVYGKYGTLAKQYLVDKGIDWTIANLPEYLHGVDKAADEMYETMYEKFSKEERFKKSDDFMENLKMADTPKAYKLNKEKRAAEENGKFARLDEKLKKLTRMRLEDEITRESYFEFKSEIEKEKLDLLSKRRVLDAGMVPNGNPEDPAKKVEDFLLAKMDFTDHRIDRDVIGQFVGTIVPVTETCFNWYMNFDLADKSDDMKRLVWEFTIDYKEAKSYRKERDGMLRQNQWHDLTVRVFM